MWTASYKLTDHKYFVVYVRLDKFRNTDDGTIIVTDANVTF